MKTKQPRIYPIFARTACNCPFRGRLSVVFITSEDGTGLANSALWADRFEKQRRLVLSAGMIACHGRVEREGEVIRVVTEVLKHLSGFLRSVGERDEAFSIMHGRGDRAAHPAGRDPRAGPGALPELPTPWDIYIPDLQLGSGVKVPTWNFGDAMSALRLYGCPIAFRMLPKAVVQSCGQFHVAGQRPLRQHS